PLQRGDTGGSFGRASAPTPALSSPPLPPLCKGGSVQKFFVYSRLQSMRRHGRAALIGPGGGRPCAPSPGGPCAGAGSAAPPAEARLIPPQPPRLGVLVLRASLHRSRPLRGVERDQTRLLPPPQPRHLALRQRRCRRDIALGHRVRLGTPQVSRDPQEIERQP